MVAPSKTFSGTIPVENSDGYSYTLKYDVGMRPGGGVDIANAKPGQALLKWTSGGGGQLELTNTTEGHTLPWPEMKLILTAYYPKTSLVCGVKLEDPQNYYLYLDFPVSSAYHGPAGGEDAWCGVDMATGGPCCGNEPIAIGGSVQSAFSPTGGDVILQSEQDFGPLMKALEDDATVWALVGYQKNGITSPAPPTPECTTASFIFWSSEPLTECFY